MNTLKEILDREGCSLVIRSQGKELCYWKRGVADLYYLLRNEPHVLQHAQLADKVVGKGAAALMVLGGVKEVYSHTISHPALQLLKDAGIIVTYSQCVEHIFLPIYFFTLVGAYKYGWQVGLLTAVASPIVNSLLFGMPAHAMVPVILIKSVLLALTAGLMASHIRKVSVLSLMGVVLTYQVLGGLAEWAIVGTIAAPLQDFQLGLPGFVLQVLGGYLVLRYLLKK